MNWWEWMIVGALLLSVELMFMDAQFYLVFVGTAALLTGLLVASVPGLDPIVQWVGFGALTLASVLLFRGRLYRRLRGHAPAVPHGPAGGVLTLPVTLGPGASCQVEHGGCFWTARNAGETPLLAGARVRITRVEGLTLLLLPELE